MGGSSTPSLSRGKGHGRERAQHFLGSGRRDPERLLQDRPTSKRQAPIPRAHLVPSAGHDLLEEGDGVGHAEKRRWVVGPVEIELEAEPASVRAERVRPVAQSQRTKEMLPIPANVEKRRAFRSAHPLVAVACVISGAELVEPEREHPGGVRAVDQSIDTSLRERANQRRHRENDAGRARDVVDEKKTGPFRHRGQHRVDGFARRGQRKRHGSHDHLRARPLRDEVQRVAAGVVLVVGREELVTRTERERAEDGVHTGGRIGDERDVIGARADEPSERFSRLVDARLEPAVEELHGLALHLRPKLLLPFLDPDRTSAEGSVVEEDDVRVEAPVAREGIH